MKEDAPRCGRGCATAHPVLLGVPTPAEAGPNSGRRRPVGPWLLDSVVWPDRREAAKGGGGQASRRSIRTREEQDAPWRIRVRSAVRLLRREACPPPPRHLSLTPSSAEPRSPHDAKPPELQVWAASCRDIGTPRRTGCAVAHRRPERGASTSAAALPAS